MSRRCLFQMAHVLTRASHERHHSYRISFGACLRALRTEAGICPAAT